MAQDWNSDSCISSGLDMDQFPRGASVSQPWRDFCEGDTHRKGLAHSRCSQNKSYFACMAHFVNLKYILETKKKKLKVLIVTVVVVLG